MAKLTPCFKI